MFCNDIYWSSFSCTWRRIESEVNLSRVCSIKARLHRMISHSVFPVLCLPHDVPLVLTQALVPGSSQSCNGSSQDPARFLSRNRERRASLIRRYRQFQWSFRPSVKVLTEERKVPGSNLTGGPKSKKKSRQIYAYIPTCTHTQIHRCAWSRTVSLFAFPRYKRASLEQTRDKFTSLLIFFQVHENELG